MVQVYVSKFATSSSIDDLDIKIKVESQSMSVWPHNCGYESLSVSNRIRTRCTAELKKH